jgi:hypothetical protein
MIRVAVASRHGVNVPLASRTCLNTWELCPDRV